MDDITIQEYEGAYRDDVIRMILTIQQQEFGIPVSLADQPDLLDVQTFYQKNGNFWVALCGNEIAGSIAIMNLDDGNAALRKMFVKQIYRGKGVSAALLSRLLQWSGQNGIRRIFLGTTPQFLAAHRFYEKNYFTEITKDGLPGNFPVMAVDKKFYRYDLEA